MKKVVLLLLIALSVFGNVKKDIKKCNNWQDLYSYHSSIKNDIYKERLFLKYSFEISEKFINADLHPSWFKELIKQSLKSNNEMLTLEAVKTVGKFNFYNLTNTFASLYHKSPTIHGGASITIQAEILLALLNIKHELAEKQLRLIYNTCSNDYFQHPNFNLLISTISNYSNSSTNEKTISLINRINDELYTNKNLEVDVEKKYKNFITILKRMSK